MSGATGSPITDALVDAFEDEIRDEFKNGTGAYTYKAHRALILAIRTLNARLEAAERMAEAVRLLHGAYDLCLDGADRATEQYAAALDNTTLALAAYRSTQPEQQPKERQRG